MKKAELIESFFVSADFHNAKNTLIKVLCKQKNAPEHFEDRLHALLSPENVKTVVNQFLRNHTSLQNEPEGPRMLPTLKLVPQYYKQMCSNHSAEFDDSKRNYGKALYKYTDHTKNSLKFKICTGRTNKDVFKLAKTENTWNKLLHACLGFKFGVTLMCLYGRLIEHILFYFVTFPVPYKNLFLLLLDNFETPKVPENKNKELMLQQLKQLKGHLMQSTGTFRMAVKEYNVCKKHLVIPLKDEVLKSVNQSQSKIAAEGDKAYYTFMRTQRANDTKYGTTGLTNAAITWGTKSYINVFE